MSGGVVARELRGCAPRPRTAHAGGGGRRGPTARVERGRDGSFLELRARVGNRAVASVLAGAHRGRGVFVQRFQDFEPRDGSFGPTGGGADGSGPAPSTGEAGSFVGLKYDDGYASGTWEKRDHVKLLQTSHPGAVRPAQGHAVA